MSHDHQPHDRIELQRYFSENGSITSTPNGKMSASGSFTGSVATSSVVPHTDADDQQNPTYFSIPEAQNEHKQYKANQPSSVPPSVMSPGGIPPSEISAGGSEIAYDFIPDSKHKGVPYPAGVTMQADNILYEQAGGNLHHQTLTMDRQQYKGSMTPDPLDYSKDGSACGGGEGCRRACQGLLLLLLCVAVVVALVAGVLSLAIIFTGFVDICDKCGSDATSSAMVVDLTTQIQTLEMRLQELEQRLELAMTSSTPTAPVTTPLSTTVPPATTMTVTTPTSPSPFMEGVVSLREVNLYQNCSTSVEATCLIPPADGTGRCTTTPLVPLNRPGEYVLNMNCVRATESAEPNPLIAILDVFQEEAMCVCFVPDLELGGRSRVGVNVDCGLQVTRCVSPLNVTATLATQL